MADYTTLETSRQDSRPAELYEFTIGTEVYNYTSSGRIVSVGSTDYEPVRALKRNSVALGRDQKRRALQIVLPTNNVFASKWRRRPPGETGFVTVTRVQIDETPSIATQRLLFSGTIGSSQIPGDGSESILQCFSREGSGRVRGPRYTYSAYCGHILGDPLCGVDLNLHKLSGTVSAEDNDNSTITVPGAAAFSTKFAGGYVKPPGQGDFRLVLSQSGDVLTLEIPFSESVDGAAVDCFKGCDHIADGDCDTEYSNVLEFGGDHAVPNREIFRQGLGI